MPIIYPQNGMPYMAPEREKPRQQPKSYGQKMAEERKRGQEAWDAQQKAARDEHNRLAAEQEAQAEAYRRTAAKKNTARHRPSYSDHLRANAADHAANERAQQEAIAELERKRGRKF